MINDTIMGGSSDGKCRVTSLGISLEVFPNLSRYGVLVKDLYIEKIREIQVRNTPINITVKI